YFVRSFGRLTPVEVRRVMFRIYRGFRVFRAPLHRLAEEIVGKYGNPAEPDTAELLRWLDAQTKRNLVITFGGGVNEVMREMIAASGLKVPRVPR
ncbi:hypothetical protein ABLN73_06840, partial [Mycobacterium tuberculosis]